jgi:diguanylate cyclase (GGDEF)-like protein
VRGLEPTAPAGRLRGIGRVWLLTAAILPAAAAMALLVWDLPAPEPPILISPWLFGVLFYLAEITVVHVRFRRDAHSFSMSELPLVVSLFFLAPYQIIAAQMAGSALALGFNRRQKPVKLAFNLVQLSIQTNVSIVLFTAITGQRDPLGPAGWLGIGLGITATVIVSNVMIRSAIKLSGGSLTSRDRNTMYLLSSGAAAMNAALGLVTATVLWSRPDNAWIAFVPSAVLFFAYRAYLNQRLERDRLESLYEVSGELHRLPHIEDALAAATERARSMFDAESAQILLFPDGENAPGLKTVTTIDGDSSVMERCDPLDPDSRVATAAIHGVAMLAVEATADHGHAMVVPIPGRGIGAMIVENPISDIGGFTDRDLRMLETLAGHVGVSLENGRLEDSLARLTELKDQLHQQALHDGLTGLANRTMLREVLTDTLGRALERRAAVLFLDLDDFKGVNDTHGHETGDQVLVEVGCRLQACSRPNDVVARLGGDEFALLLRDMDNPDDAVGVARRIIRVLSEPIPVAGGVVEINASVGVAVIDGSELPEEVMREADEAMYAAKGEGKGTYRVYSPGMKSRQSIELATMSGLREAIRKGQLELYYQPIVDLSDGRVAAMEALVRWNHPTRGIIGPDEFVPIAERRGVIDELGEWVIRAAADTLADWTKRLEDVPILSINLSAAELTRAELPTMILDGLAARQVDPRLLQIEITERAMMSSDATVLEELRTHGIRVALDDFGTGYSSLAYIDRLPVDTIKLAQTFLDRIADTRVSSLVEMMIAFSERMGFTTVAEGIENEAQLSEITRLGCRQGQGYHLGRPVPADDALELIVSSRSPIHQVVPLRRAAGE